MTIENGNVTFNESEFDGLSELERKVLLAQAVQMGFTTVEEFFQELVEAQIRAAVKNFLEPQLLANAPVLDAFVLADSTTQDQIKTLLGVELTPVTPDDGTM